MLWQKKKKRKKATKPKAVTLVAPQQPVEEIPQTTEPEEKEETPKQKKPAGEKYKKVLSPEKAFLDAFGRLTNRHLFTPYHVCELMAEMTMDDTVKKVEQDGYISINDPCCGAGATLIAGIHAARKQLEKANLNHQNHLLVVAQDIDETVALMCYIQLSLLGVAGYVKVGNSLTEPMTDNDDKENYWFTPMYFSNVWVLRRIFGGR